MKITQIRNYQYIDVLVKYPETIKLLNTFCGQMIGPVL